MTGEEEAAQVAEGMYTRGGIGPDIAEALRAMAKGGA